MWTGNQRAPQRPVHATTTGSLYGPDILLTSAFTEQYHTIGWYHLFMDHLSKKWSAAAALYHKIPNDFSFSITWTSQLTHVLWKYTGSLWHYRNTVVHGATDQEMANKIKDSISEKVTSLYNQIRSTPHFILK
jgi:hypothetical protein